MALIKEAIDETHAIDYVKQCAQGFSKGAQLALENIPDSKYRQVLHQLATFAVDRKK